MGIFGQSIVHSSLRAHLASMDVVHARTAALAANYTINFQRCRQLGIPDDVIHELQHGVHVDDHSQADPYYMDDYQYCP